MKRILFTRSSAFCALSLFALTLAPNLAPFPARPSAQDLPGRQVISLESASTPAIAARRARLMDIHKDGVIIIPSQYNSRGGLRDNLNFVYLTGLREPDAVLVLDPGGKARETLFRRMAGGPGQRGPRGATSGPNSAQVASPENKGSADKPIDQLASSLRGTALAGRAKRVYLPFSDLDFLART
ncbi:MAG: aminopeptidase P N-terminal domain-containing protein, partial [Candidatus Aminicenantales bacterium]